MRYINGVCKAAAKRKSPASFLNVAVLAPPSKVLVDEFKNIVKLSPFAFCAAICVNAVFPVELFLILNKTPALVLLVIWFVCPEPVIVPTLILGFPVRPEAFVAVVALPLRAPLNVAAVIVPVPALILLLFVDTAPVLEILNTLVLEEFITFNILLVLPAAVCLIVNVELAPPLVTSSLSVV